MKKITFTIVSSLTFIFSLSAQTINTVAGTGTAGYNGDGIQATAAELQYACDIAFDASGNMYITDNFNNRIRKVNTSGIISTIAGNGTGGYAGDGGQATNAELYKPVGAKFDASGNLYIADRYNHRIRKVNTSGIITTVAGNGSASYTGDGGQATNATLDQPYEVAFDGSGNMYIADYINNAIRMVNTSGVITTVAGNGTAGFNGDGGQASAAELNSPAGVLLDKAGNIYISDLLNNRVRMVNTSGVINTIAGNGTASTSGDGGAATAASINGASRVLLDKWGNMYISEFYGNRVRRVDASGTIYTLAGIGAAGFSGDGGPATAAALNQPSGLAFDASGSIYASDEYNHRIREFFGELLSINEAANTGSVLVYPNPASNNLCIQLNGISGKVTLCLYNIIGQEVMNKSVEAAQTVNLSVAGVSSGMYLLRLQMQDGTTLLKKVEISK